MYLCSLGTEAHYILGQGLLKLLWTVYLEGKLQTCLKLRNFQNQFDKNKSVGHTMHKKRPKICTGCRDSAAKIYLYHSTKIAKAKPHRVECPTDSSVQNQWSMVQVSPPRPSSQAYLDFEIKITH